ncbi:hypothetical protein ES707_19550 [subsurface metagenome]
MSYFDGLDDLSLQGRNLLEMNEPEEAHLQFMIWLRNVSNWIEKIAPNTGLSAEWASLGNSFLVGKDGKGFNNPQLWGSFKRTVQQRLLWIAKVPSRFAPTPEPGTSEESRSSSSKSQSTTGNSVFLVHGHNDSARETVARFLEKLGLDTIILHEKPNLGRTIIEKFVEYSNVGFAVVLMTADDIGGIINCSTNEMRPRTRQNVILELGFFIGALGRNRVCALFQEGIEMPSDYQGVLFVPYDGGGNWRFEIAREMKSAGLSIDMNRVI